MNYLSSSVFFYIRKYVHFSSLCCCLVVTCSLFAPAKTSLADNTIIAPERDIAVMPATPTSPDWKILWDGARNLTRDGLYQLAADAYGQLFEIKPNIEEANWEYCKVLLEIESFDTAEKITGLLLEENPGKSEYLVVAGRVAAHQKKFTEAELYFGLLFEKDPAGKYSDSALSGLAYSLRAQGLKQLSFPLLKQLSIRQPENETLIHDMASDAVVLKKYDLARSLYRDLLRGERVDDSILLQAAALFDDKGLVDERDSIYERYLKLHPGYLPFRKKLIESSEIRGDYELLMFHLTHLLESGDVSDEYLLKAADVAKNHLDRPDKALIYLERYYAAHHESVDVAEAIVNLQENMARDFLTIVENGGADLLWNDLESIGRSRQQIFTRMARLLEAEKKTQTLIDVLEIQHKNGMSSSKIQLKLAQLYFQQHEYQKTLIYLDGYSEQKRDFDFFTFKADVELKLGKDSAGLDSFVKCLELKPEAAAIRKRAIELAGKLGRVNLEQSLFAFVAEDDFTSVPRSLLKLHIQMLSLNRLYGKALDICERVILANTGAADLDFYLLRSDILRKSEKKREAEQYLRQRIQQGESIVADLNQLVWDSIEDHNLETARKWYNQLEKIDVEQLPENNRVDVDSKTKLLKIRLLLVEGSSDLAQQEIDNYLGMLKKQSPAGTINAHYADLIREQYRLYLTTGDIVTADSFFNSSGVALDAELVALRESFAAPEDEVENRVWFQSLRREKSSISYSDWLDLIENEIAFQNYPLAKKHLSDLPPFSYQSVRLENIQIDMALAHWEYGPALKIIEKIGQSFPAESYYCKKKLEVMAKAGDYLLALENFNSCYPGWSVNTSVQDQEGVKDINKTISYARLLWGNRQYEDALSVYRKILDPPVHKQLISQFRYRNIDYQYLAREQTFWSSMKLMLESDPEIIAELMEPGFLVDNRGSITGKIVSDNFAMYSWQKRVEDEFLARKAIFNKNYYFAAKSYEKLLETDKSTENKVDLATIYGRIGEYRKEAQVYEELTDSGDVTDELQDSITRNILKIRPTNTIDAELEERDGRKDVVNIRKTSLGTTFWFTPDLTKDFWFKYAYNNYETIDRNDETASSLLYGSMSYEFAKDYELLAGIGTEKFSDSTNSETQYTIELKGELDDYVSGFVHFQKEPVDDSVASLKDNVYRRYLQTGLTIDTELGVTLGGDLQYSIYSDKNEQNRFYLYSSYSIFKESLQFDMRYSYQYLASKDINGSDGIFSEDINNDFVKSYWSPESFSEHRVGVQVKKDFFGYMTDIENEMSYFLFDTGLSLEDEENVAFSARFNIFLEMSPHLLLKGDFSFNSSDVYDEKILSLSLHYSW